MNDIPGCPADTRVAPAAPLQQRLESALVDAGFIRERVDVLPDGGLELMVRSTDKVAFDRTVESASAWLAENGIDDAGARFDGIQDVVLRLPTETAVEQLIDAMLAPHIHAQAAACELADTLDDHGVLADVLRVGTEAIHLVLADSAGLATVARFAALLGGDGIDRGLKLGRHKGMQKLADRLGWLVTGITGRTVKAKGTPGCEHAGDQLELRLSVDDVWKLLRRMRAAGSSAGPAESGI